MPFTVRAEEGKLWITPLDERSARRELVFKGTNWAGFQAHGCPHELWKHSVQEYVDFLRIHQFNAVRLPLSVPLTLENATAQPNHCGEYGGRPWLSVLDDVLDRLRVAGIFVVIDMHTISEPEAQDPLWHANADTWDVVSDERPLRDAWSVMADRYCASQPHVIGVDLFNEPYSSTWGASRGGGHDWASAAERLGDHVLERCSRWLILVSGVADYSGDGCHDVGCCCPNIRGQLDRPLKLRHPGRLVLSPHVYGAFTHASNPSPQALTNTQA
jgi:endoglucanase